MSADSATDGLVRVLGSRPAAALRQWAEGQGRTVRLASPEWKSAGYTGAVLAAINVSTQGEPDIKVIVKVCPPGPYARETTAHREAKEASTEAFYSGHLVEQVYSAHHIGDGGVLMFQGVAGGTLDCLPLSRVPDERLADSCREVVRGVLADWNPARIRARQTTAGSFLRDELRGAIDSGGSVQLLASQLRLLQPDAAWIRDNSSDAKPLPNPLLMASHSALGADITFDVIYGPTHGDLHLENVLIPFEYGSLEPERFQLVDLSTFRPAAPITRDPVTLMLSVIAPGISDLRLDEQEALLGFVLEPWIQTPRLSALTVSTLETIYRTGNEAIKGMRLGEWRSQFLLSVQASALHFTSFANLGDAGRWWFLRLAARAGAEFLRRHHRYEPALPIELQRPVTMPPIGAGRPGSRRAGLGPTRKRQPFLLSAERAALTDFLAKAPVRLLSLAYEAVAVAEEGGISRLAPAWTDRRAAIRALENLDGPSEIVPGLLIFADRLAHLSPTQSIDIHRWLTSVGRRHDLSDEDLRNLCVESTHASEHQAPIGASPARVNTQVDRESDSNTPTVRFHSNSPNLPGGSMKSEVAPNSSEEGVRTVPQRRQIIGNLPTKNPAFTGREQLMRRMAVTLNETSKVSVIPQALHGLGGVGKTQLATEFVHRNLDQYRIVWWISAEDPSLVRASLVELASKLDLPAGQEVRQTIALVLDELSTSTQNWMLVYDNVDRPEDLHGLVPSAGGHVIITSRNNAAWASRGGAIEVDVFERSESIELLQRHGHRISVKEADVLAEKLGDLPLALEQAGIWHGSTGMPVAEYLDLFDKNLRELLTEGQPPDYPHTVYGILKVAVDKLRADAPSAAELLELFAFLGAEPMSVDLLRRGRSTELSEHLAAALQRPIELNRAIRELRRYGLARVDTEEGQRLQVHRLLQKVLREELKKERLAVAKNSVQHLLASANPGYPDEPKNWPVYVEIGPHIHAADMIEASDPSGREVVLDQIRYLYKVGDYEASKALGEAAVASWSSSTDPALGEGQELALLALRHLANALRSLGETTRARQLNNEAFERFRNSPQFGQDHEHTLYTSSGRGVDLRLEGDFAAAFAAERENTESHKRVFGDEEPTWRAQNNLAASLRHLGKYHDAAEIDNALVDKWRKQFGDNDPRTLFCIRNLARDMYDLGQYRTALDMQRKTIDPYRNQLSARHGDVILAERTITIAARKCGYFADARDLARTNYHDHNAKFGARHEHTLSAKVSYANALRCCGEHTMARGLLREAADTYRELFGARHPFTLAATVNLAIALRASGDREEAATMGEQALASLTEVLGPNHPFTLVAANGRSIDLANASQPAAARQLSSQTLDLAREVYGEDHPMTLAFAVNAAFDLQAAGEEPASRALLDPTIGKMREVLGPEHRDVLDAVRGERVEVDLEPPPT